MNHQPYEKWILDDSVLSVEEKNDLTHHLQECPECLRLQQGWMTAEHSLKTTLIQPAPGNFTKKWNAHFALRKREQEKRQARNLVISLCSLAGVLFVSLVIIVLPDISLISLTASLISTGLAVINGIQNFGVIILKLFRAVPTSTLAVTIFIVAGWVLLVCFTLGLSIWKLAFKRGIRK